MRTRRWLRDAGRLACVLLSALGLYLLFQTLHLPRPALFALSALLLLVAIGAAAFFSWRCAPLPSVSSAADEADARADLKDELKSAYWFARLDTQSAAQALMLRHAAQTVRRLDVREVFPLRLPGSFSAAVALSAIALALALGGRFATQPAVPGIAVAGDLKREARAAPSIGNARDAASFPFEAAASSPSPREESELWRKAQALAQSLNGEERAELQRAIETRDLKRVRELLEPSEQPALVGPAGPDARQQASQVSADVAQGILERLHSLLGQGSEPKREAAAQAGNDHEDGVPGWRDNGAPDTQRRDTEQHTTMDALNDALKALSQAATGDRPMANGPPGQTSQNNGSTNINGGAMGMRVNTSQAGPGGEDTPPDTPSEGVGQPVLGKPTLRLAAQLQRLATGTAHDDPGSGSSEGFYAATQAQAARLDFAAAQARQPGANEAALAREQVPIAYRASVKRYFLTEHSKER
jgi:hypothetical protein